jgi:hypothetical protein
MKTFLICTASCVALLCGCGDGQPTLTPTDEKAMRASFHKTPDINTLKPDMRKRVEAMMAASKSGQGPSGSATANKTN